MLSSAARVGFLAALLSSSWFSAPTLLQPTTWAPVGLNGQAVEAIAIDPTDASVLYVATNNAGVLKSTDGGASWLAVNNGISALSIFSLAIDPSNPATVYASGCADSQSCRGAVYKRPIAEPAGKA
jgi:hypothetical protein